MFSFLIILHIVVSLFLILIVLLQTGKGASLGAAFGGGSSQTVFGSRGPGSFMGKLTTAAAAIYMITSLSLAVMSSERGASTIVPEKTVNESTVKEQEAIPGQETIPAEEQKPANEERAESSHVKSKEPAPLSPETK